jgi:anti-sigma factor RsiW
VLNPDQIELLHREIDGANSPEESAAVRSLIESDAEARALEADLRHVTEMFDQVGTTDPPPHLRQAILDGLPRQDRATSASEGLGDLVKAVLDGFRKRPRFALASSLCVGFVAGFAVYAALAGSAIMDRSNSSDLTGTLLDPRAADELETVKDVAIDVPAGSGRLSVRVGPNLVVVELASDMDEAVDVLLTFPEGAYGLRGFSQSSSEVGASFAGDPGVIHVTTSGSNTHTFFLNHEGPAPSLALSLVHNGKEVFTTTLLP